ncbi:BQ2448_1042 [Microbotryum intermedium]|uniref:BQ2448_1042 protein n=1 Tax=Microbotryum intermedium TaxID=269621 RepID=A0A238FET9_9BASI|nr:BQ2448_1042 [Microbotryum intermedium]
MTDELHLLGAIMRSIPGHLATIPDHVRMTSIHLATNPLNLSLLVLVLFLVYTLLPSPPTIPDSKTLPTRPTSYNWRPVTHVSENAIVWTEWTPKELAPFDGTNQELQDGRILFAIRRKVYDVSGAGGKTFYGPGGAYSIFAGRDASRGLAKQSFDEDMLTSLDKPIDPLDDLTKAEWDNLRDWEGHFQNKYIMCGDYVEPK